MVMMGRRIISRYVARFTGCTLGAVAVAILVALSAYAVGKDQRRIFDLAVPYHNIASCVPGGGAIGDNKDYAGRQILTDEEIEKVKRFQPAYQKAAAKYGMQWQVLAAVHYRESSLKHGSSDSGGACEGPYGVYPREAWLCGNEYDDAKFDQATERAADDLEKKRVGSGGGDWNDPNTVKKVLFYYNGVAGVYKQQALRLGFDQAGADRGEGSPYVMNIADEMRDPEKNGSNWGQIKHDNGGIEYPANKDYGAYVVYAGLGGGTTGNSSSSSSADANKKLETHIIWVGDKRVISIKDALGQNNKDDNAWVTDENDGYDWFINTAINQVSGQIKDDSSQGQSQDNQSKDKDDKDKDKNKDKSGSIIVVSPGVGDIAGGAKRYGDKLKELMADNGAWAKAKKVFVLAVGSVKEDKAQIKNADIENFNKELKNSIVNTKKVEFIDIYSKLKDSIKDDDYDTDGVKYKEGILKKIYDLVRTGGAGVDKTVDRCGSSSSELSGPIAKVAEEMANWSSQADTCYVLGGGHGSQEDIDKRIAAHFNDGNGVDCSGFTSAVLYKATGRWRPMSSENYIHDKDFQKVSDPQPGDFIHWSGHIEILLKKEGGKITTAGSHSSGCGKTWKGPSIVTRDEVRNGEPATYWRYTGEGVKSV